MDTRNEARQFVRGFELRLAARWIGSTGSAAPIESQKLPSRLWHEPDVLAGVHPLLEQNRSAPVLRPAPAVPPLNAFVEAEPEGRSAEILRKPRAPRVVSQSNERLHRVPEEDRANNSSRRRFAARFDSGVGRT